MIYEVSVEERGMQLAAVIEGEIRLDEVGEFLGTAYGEIFALLNEQGIAPAGAPFARYEFEGDVLQVAAGVPVTSEVSPRGRVAGGTLPGGLTATTLHVGSYDAVPAALDAVHEWAHSHGYTPLGAPWESYLDGPEVPEPRTQVCVPVGRP